MTGHPRTTGARPRWGNPSGGAAYIFYGDQYMITGDDVPDVEFNYPETDSAYFGSSVAVGDFNADGYDDAIVAASGSNNPNTDEGVVYIFYGASSMTTPDSSADITLNYPETDGGYFGGARNNFV